MSTSDRLNSAFSRALGPTGLRVAGKLNVPIYRLTRGRVLGRVAKAPVLLLTTTGRRSGKLRTAPVCYIEHEAGLVVIGSNAGNPKPPAWALNLVSTPEAEVEIRGEHRTVRARVTEGDERELLWMHMTRFYAGFDDYRARTSRDIRLFVLEPR